MYRCLCVAAPLCLMDECALAAEVAGRWRLRFATQRGLVVPRCRSDGFDRRRFSVAGPSTWGSLPDGFRGPELSLDAFRRQLRHTFLQNIDDKTY